MFLFGIIFIFFFICILFYYFIFFKRIIRIFIENKRIYISLSIIFTLLLLCLSWPFFSIKGMIILHFLIINLTCDILYFLYEKRTQKNIKYIYKSGLISLIITAILISYGYINMNTVYKKEYVIHSDKIENLKIAALSDLHFGISMDLKELQKYCQDIEEENIDLLVLVGDLVDEGTTKENMIKVCDILGEVESTYGTYFVFGNHDPNLYSNHPNYTINELRDCLSDNNITILEDEYLEITDGFTLIGRKDRSTKRKTISDLVTGVNNNHFLFMLDHQPYEFNDKVNNHIDLSISGHSHAGQIWPAGPLMELIGINDLNYGYKQIDDSHFITTSGIAGWGFPIRTQNYCEYLIIEVTK